MKHNVKNVNESAEQPKPEIQYATFNRRLIASTIDLCVIMLLFMPLMAPIQNVIYGHDNLPEILERLKEQSGGKEIDVGAFFEAMKNTHFFYKLVTMNLISFILIFFLTIFCWIKYNISPGKWLLGCRIVDAKTLQVPTPRQYVIRFFGYIIAMLPIYIGFFSITWDKRKQGWHDKLAHTVVIVEGHDFNWFSSLKNKLNQKYKDYLAKDSVK